MAGNHVLLETISLTQSAASVVFDNIPQTGYTDLKVVVSARSNRSGALGFCAVYFNGSFTNQTVRRLRADGSTVSSSTESNNWSFVLPGGPQTANTFNNAEVYIPNYTSSNIKSFSADGVQESNETSAFASLVAGLTTNTAAITSVTFQLMNSDSFVAGSTFSLYGVAATGTTPAVAPKATGGNIVANDGTYWYHAFLSSGTFTPQTLLTCDLLVIAGGGGGGENNGGGGAGGLLSLASQSLTATNYPVTVGAGGRGYAQPQDLAGDSGSNSQFASLTAAVGGGGGGSGGAAQIQGKNGGSGGGALSGGTTVGLGTSGQGNNGGQGVYNSGNYPGGGGGGAGAVGGTAPNSSTAGSGGAGSNAYSSWATVTSTGVSGFFAGGGGGGTFGGGTLGSGGSGGGGAATVNGTANTGGGGGGGKRSPNAGSGNGGSGIVIIRYAMV